MYTKSRTQKMENMLHTLNKWNKIKFISVPNPAELHQKLKYEREALTWKLNIPNSLQNLND